MPITTGFRTLLRPFLFIVFTIPLLLSAPLSAQEAANGDTAQQRSDVDLLIDVIENDGSRADLIEKLKAAQLPAEEAPGDKVVEALAGDQPPPPESLSFGRRIALITQDFAEGTAARVETLWSRLATAPARLGGLNGVQSSVILDTVWALLAVIVATVAVFLVLRSFAKRWYVRMGAAARGRGLIRAAGLFLASGIVDILIVIAAWAAGYVLAVIVLGSFGSIDIRQTLYLNAFLIVEVFKVATRLVLSPSATHLRPLPVDDRAAAYLSRRINFIIGLVGYGQLLVVPILNANVSPAAGQGVSALIALVVLAMTVWLVTRNRRAVADWLLGADSESPRTGTAGWLARNWHWPVLIYLVVMFFVVLASPPELAFGALLTSGQVALVVLVGLAVSTFLTRAMVSGVILPTGMTQRMPLLQTRLNRFVPRTLFVLRTVILVLVVVFALNAIGMLDLRAWLASQIGLRLTGIVVSVALVLVGAFAVWVAMTSWVDYRLNPEFGRVATSREQTLLSLARNAATIAIIIITLMFVLAEIGLNIGPLLASAGVLGLAIGFGAQKMVQDIITGVFIQFENAMNVGDVVTVGGTTGTVEKLTIRSVSLRDLAGAFHIIPFSSVDMVTNYMRDFGYFVCDMGVAYRENVEEVRKAMEDAFAELRSDPEKSASIMADLEWFGLNAFADSAVVLRARIKCLPGTQWGVGRAYNGILKRVFDERGIEIPFPHQTIYLGESKDGKTQSVKVELPETAEAPKKVTRKPASK